MNYTRLTRKRSSVANIALVTVLGASLVVSLGACSSGAPSSSSKVSGNATITIKTFQFTPNPVTVAGGNITVRNDDDTTHTFTSDEAGLFKAVLAGPGATKSVTIPKGTHKYHCEIHTSMTGSITVT